MRLFVSLALVAVLGSPLTSLPAAAQQQSGGVCRYAGLQFTEPSTVRIGGDIVRCDGTKWFVDAAATTTNCIFASTIFTTGAVVSEEGHALVCLADGTWSELASAK